jgi:AhpD family alkylhydroperoxidase
VSFLKSLPDDAQIFDVFASRPEVYEPFVRMVEQVSRGESPLSPGERELIGAHVSELNRCPMCVDIHRTAAKEYGVDVTAVDAKLAPLLAFVTKLTETPHKMTDADAGDVYAAGWDEAALHDAVLITGIASFMNRFVFGLGIESDDAYREAAGRAVETEGYASRFRDRLSREDQDAEK